MNAPIKIAQASNQGTSSVHVIKLVKPGDGQAVTVKTGFEGKVRIDFSGIADERISIVRVGETAIIYFHGNKSTITLDPFFGSDQWPLANLEFQVGPDRIFGAQDIAALLPFTVYQGILPTADGQSGNEQDSGASFNPAIVADLPPIVLNELMPPEVLPPIEFHANLGLAQDFVPTPVFPDIPDIEVRLFSVDTALVVEEEHISSALPPAAHPYLSEGNEDTGDDAGGFDGDTDDDKTITTHQVLGQIDVTGGSGFFSFKMLLAGWTLPSLSSQGQGLSYKLEGPEDNVLVGYVASNGADRVIFTLELSLTGFVNFTLYDQLDHDLGGGENVLYIDFSGLIEVTDLVTLQVRMVENAELAVIDDVPILTSATERVTIDENDIATPWSLGTSPFDGNTEFNGLVNPAIVTGNLAGLVKFGSDEHPQDTDRPMFRFTGGTLAHMNSLGLMSKQVAGAELPGIPLTYAVSTSGDWIILTATEPGSPSTANIVFELRINQFTGDYEFRLFDELTHALPGDPNGLDEILSIDFGQILEALDYDGDPVSLGGAFVIDVIDDVPQPVVKLNPLGIVQHDETPGVQPGNILEALLDPADSDTNSLAVKALFAALEADGLIVKGDDPDVSGTGAIGYARSLLPVVLENLLGSQDGADSPATKTFSLSILDSDSGLKVTDGSPITLQLHNGLIIGVVASGLFEGQVAFAIAIDNNGHVSVAQYLSLWHPTPGSSHDEHVDLNGKIGAIFTITDTDGDSVSTPPINIGGNVRFDDDGPSVNVKAEVSNGERLELNLQFDETIGSDRYNTGEAPQDNNGASDDTGKLLPLKVDISANITSADAIGKLTTGVTGGLGALFNVSLGFGADGPSTDGQQPNRTDTLSFDLNGNGRTNLVVTELAGTALEGVSVANRTIYLVKVSDGVIEGRIPGPNGTLGSGNDDFVAFRITILDPTNPAGSQIQVEQFLAIDHDASEPAGQQTPENPSLFDEQINLLLTGNGSLNIVLTTTVTDGDGDTATDSASVTLINRNPGFISFDDDGPTITSVTKNMSYGPELIVNGSFEAGHSLTGSDWDIFHGITGWTSDGTIPFEIQTGGVGGLGAQNGNAHVELDSDTEGNPDHMPPAGAPDANNTNATIQQTVAGTVAGQVYELSFWYAPRPGYEGSSGMKVFFGGDEVWDSATAIPPVTDGWQQITINVTASGPNSVLAFTGTGTPNEFGAFLDNVSLKASPTHILDDEDTKLNPAVEIQGGPGDDGNGVVASGKINFDAGSDGLKSIVIGGIDAPLSAIWVDGDGVGHPESVSYQWVADGAGGTLYGLTDNFDTIANPAFKISVDADGNYVFTLYAPLNHPLTDNPDTDETETSWEDNLQFDFPITITDGDGDTATGVLCINVDDDSPEFVFNSTTQTLGIEDGTVTQLGTGVTKNLNLVFGADGEHETNGVKITGWPDLPGVTETLSADGKTLTATIDGTNGNDPDDVLYTLVLNPNGTYTFTQFNNLPGGVSILPTVNVGTGYGPTAERDYGPFKLVGLGGLMNGSGAGVGVNDNNMDDGDKFRIVFDNEMTSAALGINHVGNGTMRLLWIARDEYGVQVASGTSATFNADGTITITPPGGIKFFQLDIETDWVSGPNPNAAKFKLISIGGESEGIIPLESLTFQITGMDGDGDAVSDTFTIDIDVFVPLSISGTFNGVVEEEHLQPTLPTSGSFAITASGNEDTQDAGGLDTDENGVNTITNVQIGAFAVTGGDGTYVYKFADSLNDTNVVKVGGGNLTSGGQPVLFHVLSADTLIGYVNTIGGAGYQAGDTVVFSLVMQPSGNWTFTLYDNVDHPTPTSGGATTEETIAIDLDGKVIVDDEAGQSSALSGSITIIDDTPTAVAAAAPFGSIIVDETFLHLDASANFASLFTPHYGADGPGTVGNYTLGINAGSTGLVDTATGQAVVLSLVAGAVEGRTATSNDLVFRITVDGSGNVTLDQVRAIAHDQDGGPALHNDPKGLAAANRVTLTATVTDGDGDTATATANIGNAFIFLDDGPTLTASATTGSLTVDETNLGTDATLSFASMFFANYGADGPGSVGGYTLGFNAGATGLIDTATGQPVVLSLNGGAVEGKNTNGDIVFRLTVSGTGVVTLDQQRAVAHDQDGPTPADHDDPEFLLAANLITLTATITDGDGDTNTATLNIGNFLRFEDDGPSATNDGILGSVAENAGATVIGTVAGLLANDNFGADGQHATTSITIAGGDLGGTVTIDAGNLVYTPAADVGPGGGTETFVYTITDGDGDWATATFTVSITDTNKIPTAGTATAFLDDEGLTNGILGDGSNSGATDAATSAPEHTDSGFLPFDFNGETPGVIRLVDGTETVGGVNYTYDAAPDGLSMIVSAGATNYMSVTITNPATGAYTVTLLNPINHPSNHSEDNVVFNIKYEVQDSSGDVATGTLVVDVDDDTPVAQNDTAHVVEGQGQDFNVCFILDYSGSIDNTELNTMLNGVKAAAAAFFAATGDVKITTVLFASEAVTLGGVGTTYTSLAAFNAAIDATNPNLGGSRPAGLGVINGTDYTAAIQQTIASYERLDGWNNQVFFISDGDPNQQTGVGSPLLSGTATNWSNFVSTGGFDVDVTSIGIGVVSQANLQAIDVDGSGEPPHQITQFDQLITTLLNIITVSDVSGNVLFGTNGTNDPGSPGDDGFGADGGRILSITVGTVTYTWNGTTTITKSGSEAGNITGSSISVATPHGGTLTFDFTDGDWTYNVAPSGVDSDKIETFTYSLVDGDGDQASATLTINVENTNSAPVNIVPASISVPEDTATKLTAIQVSDVDAGTGNLTVTLSIPGASGALSALSGSGVTVGGSATALTLTGTLAAINAFLSDPAQSVTYTPVANSTADVTLTINTNDNGNTGSGGPLSDTDQVTLDLQPVNDAPTANITNLTFNATEQNNLTLANQGINFGSVADIDAGSSVLSVTLSVTFGTLTVTAGNSGITGISGSGTSSVSFNGTLTQINNLLQGVNLSSTEGTIVYNANSDTPPATATLTLQVNDNGNTGSGGAQTAFDTATINIAAVNDAPTTDLNGASGGSNNTASFIEQTPILISPNGTVTDVDSNIQSMTVTLTNRLNGNAIESLSLNGAASTAATGAGLTVNYTASTGVLSITGAASPAVYQSILQGILYNNTSDAPNTTNRSITVVVNDGAVNSSSNTVTVNVAAVNDAPTADITNLTFNATEQTNLTLANTGISLGSVADVDAGNNSISITLSVDFGILTVVAGNSGVTGITGSGTSSVSLNGTIAQINNLLGGIDTGSGSAGTIVYNANSDTPPATATLTLLVNDTGDTGSGGAQTAFDTATINIAAVNDAPTANNDTVIYGGTVGSGASFQIPRWALLHNDTDPEGSTLSITATSSVSDLTSASLATANVVTITNNSDSDWGSFVYTASDGGQTNTATVTITSDTGTMQGGSGNEILIGTNGAQTINGGGGNDILIGNGGSDTLNGEAGNDLIVYVAGVNSIDGGSNTSNNLLTAGNRGDVLSVSANTDFTALGDIFQGIETISMAARDGSAATSITFSITDVLQMADTGTADPGGTGYGSAPALRIDGDAGDVLNLANDAGTWLAATGATGIPDGYNAYVHVTSGSTPTSNEDAYLFVATGISVNGLNI